MSAPVCELPASGATSAPAVDPLPFVRSEADGSRVLHLMVEGVHCGGCVRRIERALQGEPDVESARVNLTTRRLVVRWRGPAERARAFVERVVRLGYGAVPYDPERLTEGEAREEKELLRALAVAGFAAGNVMLLAVSDWAGQASGDMGPATRALFHWIEALIAFPAIFHAGRPFFRSALSALSAGHTNMDVPISLAVLITPLVSLHATVTGGPHVWFDSALTLLFFLLIGRYLDRRARGVARSAVERLVALTRTPVTLLLPDGTTRSVRPEEVRPGDVALVAAGERIPADGTVEAGTGSVDTSAITGETVPRRVAPGERVFAGTVNLEAPLRVRVDAVGEDTLLAEIVRLMEAAEQRRGRHVALADRIAGWYAPAVHTLAALAFAGWWLLGGVDWQQALLIATSVLIITCPCALGLAVPAVQVIASGRLLQRGVLLKSATALERFARVDTVVFDKTGTLTEDRPTPRLAGLPEPALRTAASLAHASRHPLARALAAAFPHVPPAEGVEEVPGEGLRLVTPEGEMRLGRRAFAAPGAPDPGPADGPELWFSAPGITPFRIPFTDRPRPDAATVVAELRRRGLAVLLLSGDRGPAVERIARETGIGDWKAELRPDDKVRELEALRAAGRRVLMVGDGLNDAPALAAAHASISPASAVDISRTAADAVFQGRLLAPVVEVLDVARRAERLVVQNLALAFAYNAVAVPLAMAGLVTPLVAAIAMSSSSLTVVGNAMRLARA
ncbi:putative copper-importing P-type ATPase A [bacterium HR39]|nr:putative copper-importing P-type ATPase A [bacterium HR39]